MQRRYAHAITLYSILFLLAGFVFESGYASKEDEIEALRKSIEEDQKLIDAFKEQQNDLAPGGLPDVWLTTEKPRLTKAIADLTALIAKKTEAVKRREQEITGQFYNGVIKSLSSFEEPAFSKAITDLTNFFKENETLMTRLSNEIKNRRVLDFFQRVHHTFTESQERGKTKPYKTQKDKVIAFFRSARPKLTGGKESRTQFGFRELANVEDLKKFDAWLQEIGDAQTIEQTAASVDEPEEEEEETSTKKTAAKEKVGKGKSANATQEEEEFTFQDYKDALSSFDDEEEFAAKAKALRRLFIEKTPLTLKSSQNWMDILKSVAALFTKAKKRGATKPNVQQKQVAINLIQKALELLNDKKSAKVFNLQNVSATDIAALQRAYDQDIKKAETEG